MVQRTVAIWWFEGNFSVSFGPNYLEFRNSIWTWTKLNNKNKLCLVFPFSLKNNFTFELFSFRPYSVWPISGIDSAVCDLWSVVCLFLTP